MPKQANNDQNFLRNNDGVDNPVTNRPQTRARLWQTSVFARLTQPYGNLDVMMRIQKAIGIYRDCATLCCELMRARLQERLRA